MSYWSSLAISLSLSHPLYPSKLLHKSVTPAIQPKTKITNFKQTYPIYHTYNFNTSQKLHYKGYKCDSPSVCNVHRKFCYYIDPNIWQGECVRLWRASECHSLTFLTAARGGGVPTPILPFTTRQSFSQKFLVYTSLSLSLSLPRLITDFSFHTLIKRFNGKQSFVFISSSCVIRLIF